MIWVGGQVDLTPAGVVCNPSERPLQTRNAMAHFSSALHALECDLEDLVFLLCFYVNDGSVDEGAFLEEVASCLPDGAVPAINAVPVPYLAYPGMMVEIEGYAMRREDGGRIEKTVASHQSLCPLPTPFSQAVRSGKMIFVSGQYPRLAEGTVYHQGDSVAQTRRIMEHVTALLGQFGASCRDVVKLNRWYAGNVGIKDFEPAALACAGFFDEPGPAATGIPLPRHADPDVAIKISVVAMLGEDGTHLSRRHVWPESLWDWHIHLPYKHGLACEEMIFLGGQVSLDKKGRALYPNDLPAQTHQAMQHIGTILNELGADYDDVCKITTVYQGDCGSETLHGNLSIRAGYFRDPGPATTGIPLPALAYESMVIEIDTFAMKKPDKSG
jgi:enamine deaminase RidA (YjgF/YER057c/UK114 family)